MQSCIRSNDLNLYSNVCIYVTETSTPARDKWRPIGAKAPRSNIRYTVIHTACTVQQVWPHINAKQWAKQTKHKYKTKTKKKF